MPPWRAASCGAAPGGRLRGGAVFTLHRHGAALHKVGQRKAQWPAAASGRGGRGGLQGSLGLDACGWGGMGECWSAGVKGLARWPAGLGMRGDITPASSKCDAAASPQRLNTASHLSRASGASPLAWVAWWPSPAAAGGGWEPQLPLPPGPG